MNKQECSSSNEERKSTNCQNRCTEGFNRFITEQYELMKNHRYIPAVTLVVFIILCGAGLSLCFDFHSSNLEEAQKEAQALAIETGNRFSELLDLAILPLYGLAQFAQELDIFQPLPQQIGTAGEPGAAPLLGTHRNVSGICDRPSLVQRFEEIAKTIKTNAGGNGVIVNLQLAPQAVVCFLYPQVNTEDFEDGIIMNNTAAIGHDLLNDPQRKFIAQQTVPADGVVIAGPLPLVQGGVEVVEQAFIARLPINSANNNTIVVNDVPYNKWGFAVTLINWKAVVERTGIYHEFAEGNCQFRLTRTDQIYNETTSQYIENVVVLAESNGFSDQERFLSVTTSLQTTNNEWEMTIKYQAPQNLGWAIAVVVIVSLLIALLVYTIMVQKQLHTNMLAHKSSLMLEQARKSAKAEREMNDFIAHEVRNPLSAAISACSFVSSAVYESQPLVSQESQATVRQDIGIIEVSLQFINDLLRSILDLQRVKSNQLVVEQAPVDLLQDVLQPVSSMLYGRDKLCEILVDCPQNLVVVTDRLRLKQIVLNLGRNAMKFVEEGFVRLSAHVAHCGSVCICVEDSGPGIPTAKRAQLFCKFQESLDSLNQGTGVGLSLCKNLVDLMGGELWLDESYQSGFKDYPGSRFIIDLKTAPVPVESVSLHSGGTATNMEACSSNDEEVGAAYESRELPQHLSVLFVDDDLMLRKLFCRSIRRVLPEWTVCEAASGEVALELCDSQHFDIIFLDQYMTSTEKQLLGTETARALRSKGVNSIICGLSANDLEIPFKNAGAKAFVIKPFPCKKEPLRKELLRILYDDE